MIFESNWWTAVLPDRYRAEVNGDCVDIVGPQEIGVLQLSAYRRNNTKVTLDDLLEFASSEVGQGELEKITSNEFRGYTHENADGEMYWRRWWIASDRTMIYATYQCSSKACNEERKFVDSIIRSLQVKD
jgi:hypothetical protein